MLTRHWYDRDSVGETLLLAAGSWRDPLRKQKLVFWTYELVLSEECDYLWATLERVGNRWGDTATAAALTEKNPLHFLQSLLRLPTPAPFDPPADQAMVVPGTPDVPAAWTAGQRSRLWVAVQDALAHRRPLRLLRLLGALAPQVAAKYLGVQHDGKRGIYHMLETVGCPVLPTPCSVSWPALPVGRVSARLFSVPRSHAPTGPVSPLATKEGCAFWRRVWATVGSVEEEEAVWATYFVDDVPDEWSAAEQAKSHAS
jgi:hypothetical protein